MRTLVKVCLVLGVAALLASPALAQRQPGGFGGFGGGGLGMLLGNKSVQGELKLDKDQIDKITAALQKGPGDNKENFDKLRDRNTSREERTTLMAKVNELNTTAVKDLLKPEQMARAKQIQAQLRGVDLFTDEETAKTLKLSDDQKDKIKTIADDFRKDRR